MLEPSKYLPYFRENYERLKTEIELIGDTVIVERLKFPEKKVGSIFITDSKKIMTGAFTSEAPEFFRVLFVGNGYYDENGKDIPVGVEQGDIIHTHSGSVKLWSSFPFLETADSDVLGLTRYGEAIARWKSEESFVRFLQDFNSRVKEEVEKRRV